MLKIRAARSGEYDRVRGFYDSLIDDMQGAPYFPMWEKDIYPTYAYLRDCVERGELYVGEAEGEIATAMVVNGSGNDGYAKAQWPTRAKPEEVRVIHILGVHPRFAGKGYAKRLVAHALDLARRQGCKAVRLDVLQGNVPAERLYRGMGFMYVDTMRLYYEDTDWMDFDLYERALEV